MTRVGGVPPVGFWGLWCPSAVEVGAGKDGYAVDVVGEGFDYAGGGWRWWSWLVRDLIMRLGLAPLLAEDVPVVLHLCEPCLLLVDVLPVSFSALHCSLPS
jgi:hypothetical protein